MMMQQYWTGFFFVASVIFLLYWITTAFIFLTAYSSAYWSLLTAVWIFILFASSFYQNRATNPSTYSLVNDFSELEGIAPLKPKISSYFYFLFALFGAVCSLLAAGFFIPSSDFRSVIFAAISSIFAGALAVVIFRSKISKLSPKKEKEQNKYCLHTTLIFLALFFSFLVLFSTIQAIMGSLTLYPAQGQFYKINSTDMHIKQHMNCIGTGSPTVLFFHGLGGQALDWSWIHPEVGNYTRSCSFDRAGCGYSESGPNPRTSLKSSQELVSLLQRAGLNEEELILVGHSMAGYNMRVFNHIHKKKAQAIVCVDCVDPLMTPNIGYNHTYSANPLYTLGRNLLPWGFVRFLSFIGSIPGQYIIDSLPSHVQSAYKQNVLVDRYYGTQISEYELFPVSAQQTRETGDLGNTPFIVISAGRGLNNTQLTRLSTKSKLIEFPYCDHYIPFYQNYSVVITEQILDLLNGN